MPAEYLLALTTKYSPLEAMSALGIEGIECEQTSNGLRCTAALEYLLLIAWTPSDSTRDAVAREFAIRPDIMFSLRTDSEHPDDSHRELLTIIGGCAFRISGDLVLYRDEDRLLTRTGDIWVVSRRLIWDEDDQRRLHLQDPQFVD